MPEKSLTTHDMISGMKPELRPGSFVFVATQDPATVVSLSSDAISMFREDEGMSMIIPTEVASNAGLNTDHPMRCITLSVYSSLEGVGLTSAVATALGAESIPCNMVAAFHHDHVFVPAEMADRAMQILVSLQQRAKDQISQP